MQATIHVPAATRAADLKVELVGSRLLSVAAGHESIILELPARGNPQACTAQLHPQRGEVLVSIGVLPNQNIGLVPRLPDDHRARVVAPCHQACEGRLSDVVAQIKSCSAALQAAQDMRRASEQALEMREAQLRRLRQMVQMESDQLHKMASQFGSSVEAFSAKMQAQLVPLQTKIQEHESESVTLKAQEKRQMQQLAGLKREHSMLLEKLQGCDVAPASASREAARAPFAENTKQNKTVVSAPWSPLAANVVEDLFIDGHDLGKLPPPPYLQGGEYTAGTSNV